MEHTSHKTDVSREADRPIRIGGTILGAQRHICAFFKSHDDQYRVLLPFIKDGFKWGEKAVHIVDPTRRDEHLQQLRSAGIDVTAAQQKGQLDLLEWADVHLQGGFFDQNRTRAIIQEIRGRANHADIDCLLEYEARANLVPSDDPVVCVYQLPNFGGDVVVDIMRTHPIIIIGGILQENPFFVSPNEFLRERRGSDPAGTSLEDRRPA